MNKQHPCKRLRVYEYGALENSTYITNLLIEEFKIYVVPQERRIIVKPQQVNIRFTIYLLHFTLKSTTYALAVKPKPLVVCSTNRGRDPGLLKKWHRLPRLWHRSLRRACSKTKTIGSEQ